MKRFRKNFRHRPYLWAGNFWLSQILKRHHTWLPLLLFTLWGAEKAFSPFKPFLTILNHANLPNQKGIYIRITLFLWSLGCNSFGCFILKCSQVHETIHQPWLCLVIWLVLWMPATRPDNSRWNYQKSGGDDPVELADRVFTESRNLALQACSSGMRECWRWLKKKRKGL